MDSVGSIIKKIGNNLEAGKNRALKEFGLTSAQFEILCFLNKKMGEQISQKDISEYLGVKHTSTINILKILEEKDFIRKEVDSENAKYRNVYLTDKGEQTICIAMKNKLSIDEIFFSGITEEEQQILIRLLNIGYQNLKKAESKKKRGKNER